MPADPTLAPPGEVAPPFLLTIREASRRFGVSARVLTGLINAGDLACLDVGAPAGRHVNPEDVKRALSHNIRAEKRRASRRFLGLLARFPELKPVAQRFCEILSETYQRTWFEVPEMLARFAAEEGDVAADAPYTGAECVSILQARSEKLGLEAEALPSARVFGATLAMLALDDLDPWSVWGTQRRNPRLWTVRYDDDLRPEDPA